MTLTLHYHPMSRAAGVIWMLEEVGVDYALEHVDLRSGAQKGPTLKALNPMGKLPTLVDDGAVVTEAAAIGLYLADRYALGRLAPAPDDRDRGAYLRWSFYAPSVIEPGCLARAMKWDCEPSQVGWGTYAEMLDTIEAAIGDGPYLLGDRFSMADVVFGGTVQYMVQFRMLEPRPPLLAYIGRLAERPAQQRARAVNAEHAAKLGD